MHPYLTYTVLAVAALAVGLLIHRYRRIAKALSASERRYRSIITAMREGIVFQQRDGQIVSCNRRAEEILGLTAAQIEGRCSLDPRWRAIREDGSPFPEEEHPAMVTLRTGEPCRSVPMGVHTPDGHLRWISINSEPLFEGDSPQPAAVVTSFEDVTERRQTEQRLIQTQKLDALGKLTGGVAHDFNNLLAVVLGNLDMVAEKLDRLSSIEDAEALPALLRDGDLRGNVAQALRAAGRGAELAQSLLAFSRRQTLAPEITDVNRLLHEIEPMLRRVLPPAIAVHVELEPDIAMTRVDRARLENALLNLVINARDAMPSGGTLRIESASAVVDADQAAREDGQLRPGPYVLLTVTDTGVGMTPETLARAVEPFFSTKEASRGAGLGLSTVYGFAKQSEGFLNIQSEPRAGTSVRLYLPAVHGEEPTAARDEPAGTWRGKPFVLVVEDDEAVRGVVTSMLESLGCRVLTAARGEHALELLRQQPTFDLLLTDVALPGGLTGIDVARQAHQLRSGLQIFFMSGYPEDAARAEGLLRPGENLLVKPFRKSDLARLLQRAVPGPG